MATIETASPSRTPFRNVSFYLALLIPAAVLAFAQSYSAGVTFSGKPLTARIHVHTALMVLWLLMLVAQPWFIRTKRFRAHRWVGRSSYVIAPAIILAALAVNHENMNRSAEGLGRGLTEAARVAVFGLGQILAFAVTWGLAILFRRRTPLHVRFMISTAFAVSTAIIFRILYAWVPGFGSIERVAVGNWTLLSLLLLALIVTDWRLGVKRSPFWVVTILIAIMHLGYWTFATTDGWLAFIEWYVALPSW